MTLDVESLCFSYGSVPVLKDVTASFGTGINAVIGPNGAGKSTLVKCLAGVLSPTSGKASFDGVDLLGRKTSELNMSYMSQDAPRIHNLTVLEFMLLGRADELGFKVTDEDLDKAYAPLEKLGIEEWARRDVGELSGGQMQMVLIAQSLVNEPDLLILDEPMNNLDLRRELEIFDVIRSEIASRPITALVVLHDLNFASRFADSVTVLSGGEIYSQGGPAETVTAEMIRDVYGVEAEIMINSHGCPVVDPIKSVHRHETG